MKISIDYDETYTRDPVFWNGFIQNALDCGHEVYCVSARDVRHMDDVEFTVGRLIGAKNCIGTSMQPKREFMWREKDIYIDVWIDDQPEMIVQSLEIY